jgi:four helix bundle protein
MSKESIILNKSFDFALKSIDLYKTLIAKNEYVLSKQFLRSATSIGANVEEALAGISKKDFTAKMSISSKEARETRYWLRLIKYASISEFDIESLLKDCEELIKILTKIVKTSQESVVK